MKTLKSIQFIAKIGKIVSTIVHICSMIGAIAGAISLGLLAVYGDKAVVGIEDGVKTAANTGDMSIEEAAEVLENVNLPFITTAMAVATVLCIAVAVVSKFAQKYFKNELKDGTPFTLRGAKELMRLGIIHICVNLGASIICGTAVAIAEKSVDALDKYEFEGLSVGLGIVFIIVSLICRYGAELTEGKSAATAAAATAAAATAPAVEAPAVEAPAVEAPAVEAPAEVPVETAPEPEAAPETAE